MISLQDSQTPLHLAVKSCKHKVVECLIEAGAEINAVDVDGRTPLHIAAASGDLEVLKVLLEHQADPNPSMETCLKRPLVSSKRVLGVIQVALVISGGKNKHYKIEKGWTPLHCAVHAGHPSLVETLLECGADKQRQTTNGDSPLHIAIISSKDETARVLLDNGANVNATNNRLQTPLHLASEHGNSELVEYLLVSGADINIKDKSGKVALAIAARGSFVFIVDTIIKADRKFKCQNSPDYNALDLAKLNSIKTDAKYENIRQILWFIATKQLKQGEWKTLAHHWKFTQEQIKAIEHQYVGPSSYKEHCYRMFLTWLSGLEYDNSAAVTKELYESLVAIGKKDVAEIMRQQIDKQNAEDNSPKSICPRCNIS